MRNTIALFRAARESGNPISDIIENLPADLAVWIDPGEVSYRMGEKGAVKILYSEKDASCGGGGGQGGAGTGLEPAVDPASVQSPEQRGFLAFDSITSSLNSLSLSQPGPGSGGAGGAGGYPGPAQHGSISPLGAAPGPVSPPLLQPAAASPPAAFQSRQPPVVYTAATFAQTKFGSTKLKTNSKKPNRMSPTEFSNYIKQRALQKSMQQQNSAGYQQSSAANNGFYDKYYSQNSCYSNNSNFTNGPNMNFNTFHKAGGNPSSGNNDFNNFGFGSLSSSTNFSNSQSDYSSLLSEFSSDLDLDSNAFLQVL